MYAYIHVFDKIEKYYTGSVNTTRVYINAEILCVGTEMLKEAIENDIRANHWSANLLVYQDTKHTKSHLDAFPQFNAFAKHSISARICPWCIVT